jgi:hypothetical protein
MTHIFDEQTDIKEIIPVDGRLPVDGSGVTQPVSGPLTDTQLRAEDVTVKQGTAAADTAPWPIKLIDADNHPIDIDHPLPIDLDGVCADEIDVTNSDIGNFSGVVTDFFHDLQTSNTATGITNPKVVTFQLKRPITTSSVTIGTKTGDFSNVKVEIGNAFGGIFTTVDESTSNTKYTYRNYPFAPITFSRFKLSFYTSDEVKLGFIYCAKTIFTSFMIQGLDEDTGILTPIATSGGDFNVLARLRNATGNTKIDPATSTIQTDGTQKTQIVGTNGTATGTIDANAETVQIAFAGYQSAGALVSGTWVGTMIAEGSIDGGTTWETCWVSTVNQSPVALGIPTPINSFTTNGTYKVFQTSGFTHYRVRSTAWTSGSATIIWSCVNAPGSFIYGSSAVIQQVAVDPNNSSTANIAGSGTFVGVSQSTLGVNSVQVNLYATQNCYVYIDQSTDGVNWDIVDMFNYYYSLGGNSWTIQATASYYRIRVVNRGTSVATVRLQTCLCPIVECLPRSLSSNGDLKVEINQILDAYGFELENTPNGELRTITPYRLVGAAFIGTTLDSNYWTSSLGTGGTAAVGNAQCILSTGSGIANNTTSVTSVRSGRYVGGSAHRFRGVIRLPDTGTANNTRRWGAFTTTDGAFFEISGTTAKVVTRKGGVDTAVLNGSLNGTKVGSFLTVDTNVHTWEIYWNNSTVFFAVDNILLHTFRATLTTWSDTMTLPARIENFNTGDSSTDVAINIRNAIISRLGNPLTQPISKYQSGQVAALVLKYGAGNFHGLAVSGVTNNAVITIFDNTAALGTILWSSGAMTANTVPFSIDLKGIPFSIGLTLAITAANANATIIYE